MTEHMTERGCPTTEVWMDFLDARSETGLVADRDLLQDHLDGCANCTDEVDELQRFNTLLLRSRVPGLSDDQWRVLDERMEMMGSEYVPPPKIATKIYFGMAMAAALGLFAVGVWHLVYEAPAVERQLDRVAAANMASTVAAPETLRAGAVDGSIELADAQGSWRPLVTGTKLASDARLRVADGAKSARLVVPGHFELRIAGGSEVRVLAANSRNTWLRLRSGEVACQVEKRRPNQQFKVLAGQFRASVVGTEFVVRRGGEVAAVSVRVTEGAVRVDEADQPDSAPSETTTMVRAGNRWRFASGRVEFGPIVPTAQATATPAVEEPSGDAAKAEVHWPMRKNVVVRRRAPARDTADTNKPAVAAQTGQPVSATPAAKGTAKVVEIRLPAQWHDKAHEEEVRRLEKLGVNGAEPDAKKQAGANKKKSGAK